MNQTEAIKALAEWLADPYLTGDARVEVQLHEARKKYLLMLVQNVAAVASGFIAHDGDFSETMVIHCAEGLTDKAIESLVAGAQKSRVIRRRGDEG